MMFYSENVWSSQFSKQTKRCVHWIIQVIGSLLALSGILVKYLSNNGKHFQTIHSTIGLISAIFIVISLCSGIFALKSFQLRNILRPTLVKFLHYVIGIVAIVLGIVKNWFYFSRTHLFLFTSSGLVALCYGYDKKFMQANSDENIRFYLQIIAVSTAIFSLIGALQSLFLKIKAIFLDNWNFDYFKSIRKMKWRILFLNISNVLSVGMLTNIILAWWSWLRQYGNKLKIKLNYFCHSAQW